MTISPPLVRRAVVALLLTAAATAAPAAALGAEAARALGANGEIFQLRPGLVGELTGDPEAEGAANAALLLETLRSDEVVREIVPGTESPEIESEATMLYEPASETLYLAWSSHFNVLHSRITVLWRRHGVWSEPIELFGSAFAEKSRPRIEFTHESWVGRDEYGDPHERSRSIVHTLWSEVTGSGERVVYAPVVFEDGVPLDEVAELTLDPRALVSDPQLGLLEDLPLPPTLRRSVSGAGMIATLGDRQLFSVLRLEPVPIELTRLGDGVRASIVPVGRAACEAGGLDLTRVAAAAVDAVAAGADSFHSSVLQHVGSAVVERIASRGCSGGIESLAEAVYEEVLAAGSDALSSSGLVRGGSGVRASIVPVGRSPMFGGGALDHRIRVSRLSTHDAPPERMGRVHVRPALDGSRVIVAWETESGLTFAESRARPTARGAEPVTAWSEPNFVRLDGHLGIEAALDLLEHRLDRR